MNPGSITHRSAARAPVAAALAALVLAAVGPAPALAQAPDPARLVERAAERYAGATTVCADFRQHLSVPLLGQETKGHGRLCQRRPNLFSMRFAEPAGDLIVVDGESAWVYYPSRDPDQVLKAPIAAASGGRGLDFHREFLEDASSKYAMAYGGTESVGGRPSHRIVLTPRGDTRYERAEVWLDAESGLLRRVRIQEENGSVRTIELSNIDLAASTPPGTFSFTPPPGARVISR